MYRQFDEGTLTRGADGALYLLRPGSCVRVGDQPHDMDTEHFGHDEGSSAHVDSQSARVLIQPGCTAPVHATDDLGDNDAAMVLINPGDALSARVLVDPGDGISARVLIDPGVATVN